LGRACSNRPRLKAVLRRHPKYVFPNETWERGVERLRIQLRNGRQQRKSLLPPTLQQARPTGLEPATTGSTEAPKSQLILAFFPQNIRILPLIFVFATLLTNLHVYRSFCGIAPTENGKYRFGFLTM
jgi:hypothetical protein